MPRRTKKEIQDSIIEYEKARLKDFLTFLCTFRNDIIWEWDNITEQDITIWQLRIYIQNILDDL